MSTIFWWHIYHFELLCAELHGSLRAMLRIRHCQLYSTIYGTTYCNHIQLSLPCSLAAVVKKRVTGRTKICASGSWKPFLLSWNQSVFGIENKSCNTSITWLLSYFVWILSCAYVGFLLDLLDLQLHCSSKIAPDINRLKVEYASALTILRVWIRSCISG